MSKTIIYFFKEFSTNQFGLSIESEIGTFSALLPFSHEHNVLGGILDKNTMESLRDFLDILLREEHD
jgi:hypothetical protein